MGSFYKDLPPFKDFEQVTRDEYYRPVPEDWRVFVTDVRNSTEAIESGAYRDVNKIGVASITTVREATDGAEFPFSFGGDGASLLLPPRHVETAREQLLGLEQLARDNFELDLRVGSVLVNEITRNNVSLEVAKLELTEGRHIAIFRGGGMTLADDLIKREYERYRVEGNPATDMELTGLSCRWQPIPSNRGNVLSVLIQARVTPPDSTYDTVLNTFDDLLDGGIAKRNPLDGSDMSYKSVRESLEDELRYHDSLISLGFVARFFEILLAVAVFKFGFNPGFFDPKKYQDTLRTHCDYRKFDDMLRMIVDCDDGEKEGIETFLEHQRQDRQLFYGIQTADETLMTCYVESLEEGGHLHFVDGGNGGYTRAAKQLKQQIREAANE